MTELDELKQVILTIGVCSPRFLAMFAVIPFLGQTVLQGMVRNSFVVSLTLLVFPIVRQTMPEQVDMMLLVAVLVKEVLIGLIIGFVVSVVFWVGESVGFFIDNQRGTTMAQVVDPLSGHNTSPLGSMILQMLAVLFLSSGGMLLLLGGLFETFVIWPVFSFFPTLDPNFAIFFLELVDMLMEYTVLYASPIIIAVFVSELGLGLINRFAPSLNVFFLAMPIKSGIASFLLIIYTLYVFYLILSSGEGLRDLVTFVNTVLHE
ncbi:type III secretion system export apparatus subunit SctT [Acanthopleuribacter pedis]|uniref:Type III secretion system export apparatus subunit SctT n=1 Tax=Acanthopleuribacter pedis TaxID=442870 RepID=A0A8J7QKD2_9BACT|nr:type III secretion system export apparatus subunit SctT [Acanthopleuribacter pedis]MBO1322601.1 type III secretion system export apparatus subunit SctT [Acanthopleuribacter pedis]